MYPTLKRWISAPTPVTTSSITAESWSSCRAKSSRSSPTGIHSQYRNTSGAAGCRPANPATAATAAAHASTSTLTPTRETAVLAVGRHSARAPFTRKPKSGSAGTTQSAPSAEIGITP